MPRQPLISGRKSGERGERVAVARMVAQDRAQHESPPAGAIERVARSHRGLQLERGERGRNDLKHRTSEVWI